MPYNIAQECNIYGPIDQARCCLDAWLAEESRFLPDRQKERTAALMARYFHVEEAVTDELMMSFLRHYSGMREIDVEDPRSVRMEIKALLDQARVQDILPNNVFLKKVLVSFIGGICLTLALVLSWHLENKKITEAQQAILQDRVRNITHQSSDTHPATVWAAVKKPLDVSRIEDISYWDFDESLALLENWPASVPGARMGAVVNRQ